MRPIIDGKNRSIYKLSKYFSKSLVNFRKIDMKKILGKIFNLDEGYKVCRMPFNKNSYQNATKY